MTRLLKLPFDKVNALLLAFQTAGLTNEQALELIVSPRKVKLMVAALVQATSPIEHEQPTQPTSTDQPLVSGGSERVKPNLSSGSLWP